MSTINSAAATLAAAAGSAAAAIVYPKPGTMRATLWTMLVAAGTKGVSATDMQAVFPSWEKRRPVEAMRIMRGKTYNLPIVGRKLADGTPIWFVAGNEPAAGTVVTAATAAAAPAPAPAATVVATTVDAPAATVDAPAAAAATTVETATAESVETPAPKVETPAPVSRAVRNAAKREANRKAHK